MRGVAIVVVVVIAMALTACSYSDPVTTRKELAHMTAIEAVAGAAREETETLEYVFNRDVEASEVAALRSTLASEAGIDPKMYTAREMDSVDWTDAARVTMRVAQTHAEPLGLPPVYVSLEWRDDGAGWAVTSISDTAP